MKVSIYNISMLHQDMINDLVLLCLRQKINRTRINKHEAYITNKTEALF